MKMNKKEKIFKICLIAFITLIGVGAMTCFAISAEPSAISPTDRSRLTYESIMETHEEAIRTVLTASNEIELYFNCLENMENREEALRPANSIPTLESGVKLESREIKPFGYDGNVPSFEPATEPERPTPEVIEISNNQNGELNYVKVV